MDVFIIMVSNLDIVGLALLRIRVGNEYSPCALLVGNKSISDSTSVGVTGSNRKEQQGEGSVRYSRKCGRVRQHGCQCLSNRCKMLVKDVRDLGRIFSYSISIWFFDCRYNALTLGFLVN